MTSRTGKNRNGVRPHFPKWGLTPFLSQGFTLIELFLSLAIIAGSLVFIVSGLAGLSRHLSRTEAQIQALSLGSGKIVEWTEWLGHGGRPEDWPSSGKFEENPAFSWQGEGSPTSLDDSLYEMKLKVFGKNRSEALTSFVVNGWREDEKETVG